MATIDNTHPYFEEVHQFSQMVVANMSSAALVAANQTIHELVGFVNKMVETKSTDINGQVNEHRMTSSIYMADYRYPEAVNLKETDKIFDYMTGKIEEKPKTITYDIVEYKEPEESNQPGRSTVSGPNPTSRFLTLTAYLIGGAYEKHKEHFRDKYGSNPNNWDPLLQFFRHMRNGCFHSNKFNIIRTPQIDPDNPPIWRNYVMESDETINGKPVIADFFHVHMVIPFLDDLGQLI